MKSRISAALFCAIVLLMLLMRLAICSPAHELAQDLAARIELELRADPITFPYAWQVNVTNHAVELASVVPSEEVRTRAIHLVGQITSLPIKDRIRIHPMPLPDRAPPQSVRELGEAVQRKLEQAHLGGPTGAAEIDIYPDLSGFVTLRGRVMSLADKLLASRCLKDIPNCLAVRNYLVIDPSLGQFTHNYSYDSMPNPEESKDPDPFTWRPQPFLVTSKPAKQSATGLAKLPTSSDLLPLYPSMRHGLNAGTTSAGFPNPTVQVNSNNPPSGNEVSYVPVAGLRSLPGNGDNSSQASVRYSSAIPSQPMPVRHTNEMPKALGSNVAHFSMPNSPRRDYSVTYPSAPISLGPLSQPYASSQESISADYQVLQRPFSSATGVEQKSAVRNANANNLPPTGVNSMISYPSVRALPSIPTPTPNSHTLPFAQISSINSSVRPRDLAANAKPLNSGPVIGTDEFLRQRILSALGPWVTDVEVVRGTDKKLQVVIKIKPGESADEIARRLFQIPDLHGYQLDARLEQQHPTPR